jgi:hypothetical protein
MNDDFPDVLEEFLFSGQDDIHFDETVSAMVKVILPTPFNRMAFTRVVVIVLMILSCSIHELRSVSRIATM